MSHLPGVELTSTFDVNLSHLYSVGSPVYDSSIGSEGRVTVTIESQTKLETCIRAVNSELLILGYPAVLYFENEQPVIIVDQLAHGMARLLNAYLKSLSQQNEIATRLRSAETDLTQVQKMYRRCQEDLSEAHKAIALARERDRRAEEEKKVIQSRLKTTTDEVRKLQLNFQRYETQSAHERRKLENEVVALRERLSAASFPRAGNTANNVAHRSSKGRSVRNSSHIASSTFDSVVDGSETGNQVAPTSNMGPSNRVAAKPTRTLSSSLGAQTSGLKSDWHALQTTSASTNQKPSQIALYAHLVQRLQEREHTLLYENRELRDLVNQISSRLVRFSNYVDQHCRPPVASRDHLPPTPAEDEFDSLDEDDEDDAMSNSLRPDSSDDEVSNPFRTKSHQSNSSRKSSNVSQLLLQLPYPLVRERLTQRVRQLSKALWRRLKHFPTTSDPSESANLLEHNPCSTEFPRTDETSTPCPHLKTDNRLKEEGQPQSDAENQDPEKLSNEIKTLKELVREYEGRVQEQEVALRHALFTNMRRWNSCARNSWVCPTGDMSPVEPGTTPTHSLSERPFSRTELSKLPSFGSHSDSLRHSFKSGASQLPTDGAGDCATDVCDTEADHSKSKFGAGDYRGSLKSDSPSVAVRCKASDSGLDLPTDTIRLAPAHATFTSSPFPTRARALSVDEGH